MDKAKLLQQVGNLRQVGGLRRLQGLEGVEAGLEVIQVRTGELEFEVIPSRGLDIGAAYFRGQSLAWLSAAALTLGWPKRNRLSAGYGPLAVDCSPPAGFPTWASPVWTKAWNTASTDGPRARQPLKSRLGVSGKRVNTQ
jgi:hypothetical protein